MEPKNSFKGYLGNDKLRRAGQAIKMTKEQMTEFMKCAADPIYFAENYIKIVHVDEGLIDFKMYDYQKRIVEALQKGRRVAVNTSRQAGKTTTAVAVILHFVLFNSHKLVGLLANKGDSAREILDRIQIAYQELPYWLQRGVVEWNKGTVVLENGCKIMAAATSSNAIRGKSCALIYIDETAFVENWEEFFASVYPTISSGKTTKMLFTSTPKGLNHFYKICEYAQYDEEDPKWNGYQYIEVPWTEVPGRGEEWKKDTLQALNGDMEKFNQEFCCQFLGSSGTLIESSTLKRLVEKRPIKFNSNTRIYNEPEDGHFYAMIADVSRGKGLDYSAFQIIDITSMPYKQVCTFRDNTVTPVEYAEIMYRALKTYNDAHVLIELNDIGGQVADILHHEFEYELIIYTESAGRAGKRISGGFGTNIDRGIRTTKNVKGLGCSTIKMMIEQDQLILNDEWTLDELKTFSKKGTSYEAEPGCHDDMVMCLVLFGWMTTQTYFRDITDIDTMMRLRTRTEEEIEEDMLPMGFHVDHTDDEVDPVVHYHQF